MQKDITFFRISYDVSLLSKTTPTKSALMVSDSEIEKLNEKMDTVLVILQKKLKRSTTSEVNAKMDNLLGTIEKKRKFGCI